jgi:hypothetical protein
MGKLVAVNSVCLAEYGVIKGMAVLALVVIAYLYWAEFREKRERRRQQRALEQRRRAKEAGVPQK